MAIFTQTQGTPAPAPTVQASEAIGVVPTVEPTVTRVARPTASPSTAGMRATGASIQIEHVAALGGIEQVVVVNRSCAAQDLAGWALRSATSTTRHPLPSGLVIEPGTTFTLLSGANVPTDPGPRRVVLGRRSFWPDSGGAVVVLDRDGIEAHRRTYP
ncbi:MAG: lamin tail domain-containing protein [Chloroflexi bacterium]|nr:lamin tail domain-containing protein [Chloroflexota bacterium]